MDDLQEIPDNIKCPYCGAGNAADCEFCGACYKKLHIPEDVRAAAKVQKILAAASTSAALSAVPEAEGSRPISRLLARAAVIAGLFLFYSQWLKDRAHFSFLDFVNLAFHEAGHVFLGFFGRFIMFLGGTVFQLLIPVVCLVHLRRRGANLGWQLCVFWLGQSLLNISNYAGDAVKQALPLVGGGEHDWNYLLTETGLIAHTDGVANAIFLAGSAVIFYSFYLIGRDAMTREPIELGNDPWELK